MFGLQLVSAPSAKSQSIEGRNFLVSMFHYKVLHVNAGDVQLSNVYVSSPHTWSVGLIGRPEISNSKQEPSEGPVSGSDALVSNASKGCRLCSRAYMGVRSSVRIPILSFLMTFTSSGAAPSDWLKEKDKQGLRYQYGVPYAHPQLPTCIAHLLLLCRQMIPDLASQRFSCGSAILSGCLCIATNSNRQVAPA